MEGVDLKEDNSQEKQNEINIIEQEDSGEENSSEGFEKSPILNQLEKNGSFINECKKKENLEGPSNTNNSFDSNLSFHSYNSANLPNINYTTSPIRKEYNPIYVGKNMEVNQNMGNVGTFSCFSPLRKAVPKSRFSATAFSKYTENNPEININNLSTNNSFSQGTGIINSQPQKTMFSCFRQNQTNQPIQMQNIQNINKGPIIQNLQNNPQQIMISPQRIMNNQFQSQIYQSIPQNIPQSNINLGQNIPQQNLNMMGNINNPNMMVNERRYSYNNQGSPLPMRPQINQILINDIPLNNPMTNPMNINIPQNISMSPKIQSIPNPNIIMSPIVTSRIRTNSNNVMNMRPNININNNVNQMMIQQQQINQTNILNRSPISPPIYPSPPFKKEEKNTKMYYSPQIQKNTKKSKNLDAPRNKINLENILRQKDKRTTIMIRHIPNKYSLKLLSEEINKLFLNKYDLLYLPVDSDNRCNLGYGFINFTNPMNIISFYDSYNLNKWQKFNSEKICELAYAKIQGKNELLNHIKESGEANETGLEIYMVNDNANDSNSQAVIPMKFYQAFINFYPYSAYKIINNDYFLVESFYNF
ncbi:MAG: hypothetical protein MJ252_21465 [archaeon]|nr:hypothetical protein [archaeon]